MTCAHQSFSLKVAKRMRYGRAIAAAVVGMLGMLGIGCQQQSFNPSIATSMAMPASAKDTPTTSQGSVAAAFFHDPLAKYGQWVDTADFGPCWYPSDIPASWRPYTIGRWVYNDGCGWLWMGGEKWSWATDHYGRWVFLDSYGWVWVPGKQWSPAWVAWRVGDDYVGWAPLPPVNGVDDSDVSKLRTSNLPAYAFSFVPKKLLADEKVKERIEPVTRNVTLIATTRDTTRYEIIDLRVIDRGVEIAQIEQALDDPIPRYHVVDQDAGRMAQIRGEDVAVYRPQVVEPDPTQQRLPPAVVPEVNPELMTLERQRLDEYHQQSREQMLARQAHELSSVSGEKATSDLSAAQEQERVAFEDERQREIEALRRRQLEQRERLAVRTPPQSLEQSQPSANNEATQAKHYEIPPEWQLPRELMEPPPRRPPPSRRP